MTLPFRELVPGANIHPSPVEAFHTWLKRSINLIDHPPIDPWRTKAIHLIDKAAQISWASDPGVFVQSAPCIQHYLFSHPRVLFFSLGGKTWRAGKEGNKDRKSDGVA